MSDDDERQARLAGIRSRHWRVADAGFQECAEFGEAWPCDAVVLLAELSGVRSLRRLGRSRRWQPARAALIRRRAMASDEGHASVDFEMVPDLVCGRSYRNPESEALAVAMRAGEVTPYTGCGKPLRWVYAYRCRQCGRWLHGPCMDRHFGGVDLTAELAAAQARAERAEAALALAERESAEFSPWIAKMARTCRICDQVGLTGQIDHAPDCPFAALAAALEARE